MNRRSDVSTTWIPLSSIHPLDARGKTARTHDGQRGTVVEFIGRCVVLSVGGKRVTVPVSEVEVRK